MESYDFIKECCLGTSVVYLDCMTIYNNMIYFICWFYLDLNIRLLKEMSPTCFESSCSVFVREGVSMLSP